MIGFKAIYCCGTCIDQVLYPRERCHAAVVVKDVELGHSDVAVILNPLPQVLCLPDSTPPFGKHFIISPGKHFILHGVLMTLAILCEQPEAHCVIMLLKSAAQILVFLQPGCRFGSSKATFGPRRP